MLGRCERISFHYSQLFNIHLFNFRVDAHKLFNRLTKISELRKAKDSKLQNVVFMYVEPEAKKSHGERIFPRFLDPFQKCIVMNLTK